MGKKFRHVKRVGLSWLLLVLFAIAPAHSAPRQIKKPAPDALAACRRILAATDSLASQPIDGAPGLRVITSELQGINPDFKTLLGLQSRAFRSDELLPAKQYARFINQMYSESLVFLPSYEGKTIAAFDGVILDRNHKPVANISLKRATQAPWKEASSSEKKKGSLLALNGVSKARRFSELHEWLLAYGLANDKGIRALENLSPESLRWFSNIIDYLGFNSAGKLTRKTRVVVDVTPEGRLPNVSEQNLVRAVLQSQEHVESVVFIFGDEFLTFSEFDMPSSAK